ncbi:MAG: hypothetical protein IJY85_00005, partial [Ruminococcus sp.]|nr:hypothetical protein [Ruminococcus sp.]
NGKRCRDNRLHEPRYSKEMMCNEFKIRADEIGFEIKSGRSDEHTTGDLCSRQQLESCDRSAYVTHPSSRTNQRESKSNYDCGADELSLGKSASNIQSGENGMQTHSANDSGADNELPDKLNQPIREAVITGWETERRILLQAEIIRRMEAQNAIENAQGDCDFAVGAVDLVAGIADMASIIDESEEDEDIERHSDSKILAEEIRKKESLGMKME